MINTSASSPYLTLEEDGNFSRFINNAKAGFTADYHLYSMSKIGGGLVFDFNVGTQVPISQCQTNMSAAMGYNFIHTLWARTGSKYIDVINMQDVKNGLFNGSENTIKTWNLSEVNPAVFSPKIWCGSSAILKGGGSKTGKIFVTDAVTGKVLGSSDYTFNALNASTVKSKTRNLTVDATVIDEIEQVIASRVKVRSDTNGISRYTITADLSNAGYSITDPGWSFTWLSKNTDIILSGSNTPTTSFAVKCNGPCNSALPIALNVVTPSGARFRLPYTIDYDQAPTASGSANYNDASLFLDAKSSTDDTAIDSYLWKSPSGLIRTSKSPQLSVNKDEDFYKDVRTNKQVTLSVTDSSGQFNSTSITPLTTETELPKLIMRIENITAGAFTVNDTTLASVNGINLAADLTMSYPYGTCTAIYRSTFVTAFNCVSTSKGNGVLRVLDGSNTEVFGRQVDVTYGGPLSPAQPIALTVSAPSTIQQTDMFRISVVPDTAFQKITIQFSGVTQTGRSDFDAEYTMPRSADGVIYTTSGLPVGVLSYVVNAYDENGKKSPTPYKGSMQVQASTMTFDVRPSSTSLFLGDLLNIAISTNIPSAKMTYTLGSDEKSCDGDGQNYYCRPTMTFSGPVNVLIKAFDNKNVVIGSTNLSLTVGVSENHLTQPFTMPTNVNQNESVIVTFWAQNELFSPRIELLQNDVVKYTIPLTYSNNYSKFTHTFNESSGSYNWRLISKTSTGVDYMMPGAKGVIVINNNTVTNRIIKVTSDDVELVTNAASFISKPSVSPSTGATPYTNFKITTAYPVPAICSTYPNSTTKFALMRTDNNILHLNFINWGYNTGKFNLQFYECDPNNSYKPIIGGVIFNYSVTVN